MLNIQNWTELCCFVTACELRGCVSCWIPHSEKCCCCLTAASICMHLVWQKVLTTCNIFVLIMSVKPRPGFISLLAWSFTISLAFVFLSLASQATAMRSALKSEMSTACKVFWGQKLWFLFVWGFFVRLYFVWFKIILESSHSIR